MTGWFGGLVLVFLAFYAALVAFLYFGQRRLMYHPDQTVAAPSDYGYASIEPVWLETKDGARVHAWWKPPADDEKPVLIYFHGNAGHLGDRADKIRGYANAGYGILLQTYRYNAGAGGQPSEEGLYADGRAGLMHVFEKGIPSKRVVLYGESLGSGIAVNIAAALAKEGRPVRAVVLEAPYDSIAKVAQAHYWYTPARWLVKDRFESDRRIAGIEAPLLIVHGERDRVIPLSHAMTLFAAAGEPKRMVVLDEAAHNNLYDFGMSSVVTGFLSEQKR